MLTLTSALLAWLPLLPSSSVFSYAFESACFRRKYQACGVTEGLQAMCEPPCAAPTSLCPLVPQCLAAAGSTSPLLLSLGVSPANWGGKGSAPGCPFTCDDQANLTVHLCTQPPACPRRDPSLPHPTASLHQAEAPVHLFAG